MACEIFVLWVSEFLMLGSQRLPPPGCQQNTWNICRLTWRWDQLQPSSQRPISLWLRRRILSQALKWFHMTRCEVSHCEVSVNWRSKCQRHLFMQFKMHDMVKCRSEFSLVARFWTSKWCWWPELFTVLHIAQELETPVVRLRWCLCLSLLHLSARWQGAVCRECRGQH